jgi:hypothetical protein
MRAAKISRKPHPRALPSSRRCFLRNEGNFSPESGPFVKDPSDIMALFMSDTTFPNSHDERPFVAYSCGVGSLGVETLGFFVSYAERKDM